MAEYTDREAFIPYRRSDLVELCIEDGKLPPEQMQTFRDFCEILAAYYHFKYHHTLKVLKNSFAPFNPDADTRTRCTPTEEQLGEMEAQLLSTFEKVLQCANYSPLSHEDLQGALDMESLIPLKTSVDFDDYKQMIFYYRGDNFKTTRIKKFLRTVEVQFDNLERVALLFKFQDAPYFEARGQKVEDLSFTPGKTYIYLYKDVPRFDLELLFPNVAVSMNWRDRLLFIVPAIGAAVPVLLKVLPALGIIIGVILLVTLGTEAASSVANVSNDANQALYPALVAALSVGITFGGFAVKQYNSYKSKRLKFLKKVTDTLFFKNLVTNEGVLYTLVDSAEEEECKEIILVYYHLLTAEQGLTSKQLDNRIEEWMERKFDTLVDFDITKTLRNLAELCAPIDQEPGNQKATGSDICLVQIDSQGVCSALPLETSKAVIDYIWDHIFEYT